MTKQEMNKLLALMKANYSYAFKSMSQQEKYMLLETWTFTLQDLDAHVVFLAVMKLISTSKWLPTVAEIREQCKKLHYEADGEIQASDCYREMGIDTGVTKEQERVYNAIRSATEHLRGDGAPELSLETMLRSNNYAMTGGSIGRMLDDPAEHIRAIGERSGNGRD